MSERKPSDPLSGDHCKFDLRCENAAKIYCQGCNESFCDVHFVEHQKKVKDNVHQLVEKHRSFNEELISVVSKLSAKEILDLIKPIHRLKSKGEEIKEKLHLVEKQLESISNNEKSNKKDQPNLISELLDDQQNYFIEDYLQSIESDFEDIFYNLQQINEFTEKKPRSNSTSKDTPSTPVVSLLNPMSAMTLRYGQDSQQPLSRLLLRQVSPAILDINPQQRSSNLSEKHSNGDDDFKDEDNFDVDDDDDDLRDQDEAIKTPKVNSRIRLSNNIVRWIRGPFKVVVDGTMHAVDLCAQGTHMSETVLAIIKRKIQESNQKNPTSDNNRKEVYADITSDWIFEGENSDRGLTSPSIWMKDPTGQRVLVKSHEHPLCAGNEWIAYALGDYLGLPINRVRVGLYKNELVTIHDDVAKENEKTLTFMDLPKQIRKLLLADARLECMDLFDHIIQNVDRNQRNILITLPKTEEVTEELKKLHIYLIDHSSSFGAGKLNGLSVVANKFHSNHLSVVKFDPHDQAKKFHAYLSKLPTTDRTLIRKTLNRFASINNEQFDCWITQIEDLLSVSQYNRIHNVLYRQRDITRRFTIQWGIAQTSSKRSTASQVSTQTTHF